MSIGRMNTFISIVLPFTVIDSEGFSSEKEETVASVRAYREGRHGSKLWANRAAFTQATDLFRFRKIPDTDVTTAMNILCDGHRFEITSIEDVKGRGMYIEVLVKEIDSVGESNI